MDWTAKTFDELTTRELFDIYRVRAEVFVAEQRILYPDVDVEDLKAVHLYAADETDIVAYCRIYPDAEGVHIGRVLVVERRRGVGFAQELMRQAVAICQTRYPEQTICVQAQAHLENFYRSFGFEPCSPVYLDVGVEHIDMKMEF